MADAAVSEHVLRYRTDDASVRASVRAIDTLKSGYKDMGQAAASVSSSMKRETAEIVRGLKQVQVQAVAAGEGIASWLDDLAVKANRGRKSLQQVTDEEKAARESANVYGDVSSRFRAAGGAVGYFGGTGVERSVVAGAEVLDTIEASKLLRQELPRLVDDLTSSGVATKGLVSVVGNLGAASPQAAVAVGALAVGVGAAYVAVSQLSDAVQSWNRSNEKATQLVAGQIDALRQYYDFAGDATSEQLSTEITSVAQRMDVDRQYYADLLELKNSVLSGLDVVDGNALETLSSSALRAYNALGGNVAGLDQLDEALAETKTQIESSTAYFNLLAGSLNDAQIAANDAAARQEDYDRRKLESIQREAATQIETDQRIRDWSSEQTTQRLQDIQSQRAAYQALLPELEALAATSAEAGDQLHTYQDQVFLLDQEEARLTATIQPAVEAREAEAAAVERQKDALKSLEEFRAEEVKALEKEQETAASSFEKRAELAQDFKDESIRIEAERARTILEQEQDFTRQRLRDVAKFNRDLADFDVDFYGQRGDLLDVLAGTQSEANQARIDSLRDHNKEDLRLAKDHRRELLRIQRETDQAVEDAAATLDSASVIAAQERGRQAQTGAQDQYDTQQQRRDEDFADQLAALDRENGAKVDAARQALTDLQAHYQDERTARIQDFQLQLSEQDEDRRIALDRQQAAWQREDDSRRDHLNQQLRDLKTQQRDAELAVRGHYARLNTATEQGMSRFVDTVGRSLDALFARVSRALPTSEGTTYAPQGYATGGMPPVDEWVKVGEHGAEWARFLSPAMIYPHGQQPSSTSVHVQIPVSVQGGSGIDAAQLQRTLEGRLGPLVQREIIALVGGA